MKSLEQEDLNFRTLQIDLFSHGGGWIKSALSGGIQGGLLLFLKA